MMKKDFTIKLKDGFNIKIEIDTKYKAFIENIKFEVSEFIQIFFENKLVGQIKGVGDHIIIQSNLYSKVNDIFIKWKADNEISQHVILSNILVDSINHKYDFNLLKLKKHESYSLKCPEKPLYPYKVLKTKPDPPLREESKYQPNFSLVHKLLNTKRNEEINRVENLFNEDVTHWKKIINEIEIYNNEIICDYDKSLKDWKDECRKWEHSKKSFEEEQNDYNNFLIEEQNEYLSRNPNSIQFYVREMLKSFNWPISIIETFDIKIKYEDGVLVIDFDLPHISNLSRVKEVKFIASKNEHKKTFFTESYFNQFYDSLIYQIALLVIHVIYNTDTTKLINLVAFNGWVNFDDKSNGKESRCCILSVQASKNEFQEINLLKVDPKECFKKLKGIASSKLSSIVSIQPIISINTNDSRFVNSYDVLNNVNVEHNLAEMDWEDFEHLIREIFEKEFSINGGEVKVTQASRDGGVDAIAFDPDPIRGGKIVIQAKRYNNTVGVSAVRDLYGTVMNEGATKGILVTTSNFGPDAYDFVKNKPLTLMNGANLLFLLEKHGKKARIELKNKK